MILLNIIYIYIFHIQLQNESVLTGCVENFNFFTLRKFHYFCTRQCLWNPNKCGAMCESSCKKGKCNVLMWFGEGAGRP